MNGSNNVKLNPYESCLSYKILKNDIFRRPLIIFFVLSLTAFFLIPLVLSDSSFALQVISGDQITIDKSVQDDLLIFGETVYLDAPLRGTMVFANIIQVNAPIEGDLFAAGGQITINSNISGKLVAAGNTIDFKGKTTNAILAANTIMLDTTSVVSKDVYVASGNITNEGTISGELVAMTDNLQNNGNIGNIETISQSTIMPDLKGWLSLFGILIIIGFGFLGIILVNLLPKQFEEVRSVMAKSIIKNTLVGFLLIILFVVVIVLSAITVVGLPVSAFGLLVLFIGLIFSSLVVSFALGQKILKLLGRSSSSRHINNIFSFLTGFIILNLLYVIPVPYFGQIAQTVVVSLGIGSIYYTIRKSRSTTSSKEITQ